MIHIQWPWVLVALPLPLLVYWLTRNQANSSSPLRVPKLLALPSSTHVNTQPSKIRLYLLLVIWSLTVLAASRPQWLGDAVTIPSKSREMMLAVDLSGSMQMEDMRLNGSMVDRLTMLKAVLGDFIERRNGDRLGLILFADTAYMQTPMTYDRNTVKQMLDESVIGLVGQKTAIGDAIALAAKRFDQKSQSNKVLILVTDGQNTAGNVTPEQALQLAKAKGITIYTIGIGAEAMIERSFFGTRQINPASDLDETLLSQLAEETGGMYFRAKDGASMTSIYQQLDQLQPIDQQQQKMRPLTALFYYPLALALLIALTSLVVPLIVLTLKSWSKS